MGGGEEVFLEVRETKKKNSEYSQLYEAGRRRSWCAWTDGVDVGAADWTGNAAGFCERRRSRSRPTDQRCCQRSNWSHSLSQPLPFYRCGSLSPPHRSKWKDIKTEEEDCEKVQWRVLSTRVSVAWRRGAAGRLQHPTARSLTWVYRDGRMWCWSQISIPAFKRFSHSLSPPLSLPSPCFSHLNARCCEESLMSCSKCVLAEIVLIGLIRRWDYRLAVGFLVRHYNSGYQQGRGKTQAWSCWQAGLGCSEMSDRGCDWATRAGRKHSTECVLND